MIYENEAFKLCNHIDFKLLGLSENFRIKLKPHHFRLSFGSAIVSTSSFPTDVVVSLPFVDLLVNKTRQKVQQRGGAAPFISIVRHRV